MEAGGLPLQQEIERSYRWNFTVNTLDGASFWFGMSFISPTVILPLYAQHFTRDPLVIGLIPFLATAGYLLPQLFIANATERSPRKKLFPVTLGLFLERLPIFLMVPAAFFLATNHPLLALASFLVLYAWYRFGAGLISVGWQDMVAKIIPPDRRGRFFGITNFIGTGTGVLGAAALPFVLKRFAFPGGYVLSFAVASVLVLLSWIFLSLTREPPVLSGKPVVTQREYLRTLPAIIRGDRNFRMYLLTQIVFRFSGMATGFLVVYAVKRWSLPDPVASGFTIALQIGLAAANLVFGFLSDRRGHKLTLEIGFLLGTLSVLLAIFAPSPLWFFAILLMQGALSSISLISGVAIVYEFATVENRPTYIGLANTVPGLAAAIAPLIGGWLASAVSYRAMFVTAAAIGAIGWILLRFTVHEPRTPEGSSALPPPPDAETRRR